MYKLITHNDLDGVACAVLAKLAFKNKTDRSKSNIEIDFCGNPAEVTNKLLDMSVDSSWKKYNLIYITDCSFDIAEIQRLYDAGDKRLKFVLNGNVRMFDHHATAIEPFAKYFQWMKVQPKAEYNKLVCGTNLWQDFLINKGLLDKPRKFFVEQVRLYDTWDWKKGNSNIPVYLSSLVYYLGISAFMDSFVSKLEKKDITDLNIFTEQERLILSFAMNEKEKEIQSALRQVKIFKTESGYNVGLIYGCNFDVSELGNRICTDLKDENEESVDIAMIVNLNKESISVRTTRTDLDLGKIMQDYFNGGGHLQASGGHLTSNLVDSFSHTLIAKI